LAIPGRRELIWAAFMRRAAVAPTWNRRIYCTYGNAPVSKLENPGGLFLAPNLLAVECPSRPVKPIRMAQFKYLVGTW
jgi:hypothetical protein